MTAVIAAIIILGLLLIFLEIFFIPGTTLFGIGGGIRRVDGIRSRCHGGTLLPMTGIEPGHAGLLFKIRTNDLAGLGDRQRSRFVFIPNETAGQNREEQEWQYPGPQERLRRSRLTGFWQAHLSLQRIRGVADSASLLGVAHFDGGRWPSVSPMDFFLIWEPS